MNGEGRQLNAGAFSADGRRFAAGGRDGVTRVWSTRGGPPVAVLRGQRSRVLDLGFGPTEDRVVTRPRTARCGYGTPGARSRGPTRARPAPSTSTATAAASRVGARMAPCVSGTRPRESFRRASMGLTVTRSASSPRPRTRSSSRPGRARASGRSPRNRRASRCAPGPAARSPTRSSTAAESASCTSTATAPSSCATSLPGTTCRSKALLSRCTVPH